MLGGRWHKMLPPQCHFTAHIFPLYQAYIRSGNTLFVSRKTSSIATATLIMEKFVSTQRTAAICSICEGVAAYQHICGDRLRGLHDFFLQNADVVSKGRHCFCAEQVAYHVCLLFPMVSLVCGGCSHSSACNCHQIGRRAS